MALRILAAFIGFFLLFIVHDALGGYPIILDKVLIEGDRLLAFGEACTESKGVIAELIETRETFPLQLVFRLKMLISVEQCEEGYTEFKVSLDLKNLPPVLEGCVDECILRVEAMDGKIVTLKYRLKSGGR